AQDGARGGAVTAEAAGGSAPLRGSAVVVPGYRGSEGQRIVQALVKRLEAAGIVARAATVMAGPRPSREYQGEVAALRTARDELRAAHAGPVALVGRSFGGRICAFLAAEEPPDALVVLGHPISPPGRPRPRDEGALASVRCPTLIVQGQRDELGPLAVLERIAAANPLIDIVVIPEAGHELTSAQEREAVEHAGRWLEARLLL
ncbi:MAG: alpha/beta family hydrolase, partial [Candidatus Limnocylindria bacterium]